MGKQTLDIKVYVEDDYVYMSVKDWLKIVKVLDQVSYSSSVTEVKKPGSEGFSGGKVH